MDTLEKNVKKTVYYLIDTGGKYLDISQLYIYKDISKKIKEFFINLQNNTDYRIDEYNDSITHVFKLKQINLILDFSYKVNDLVSYVRLITQSIDNYIQINNIINFNEKSIRQIEEHAIRYKEFLDKI